MIMEHRNRRQFLAGIATLPLGAGLAGCTGLAGTSAGRSSTDAAAESAFPPLGAFIDAHGERIHYWDRGNGQPVVLIHGASGNLRDWTFDLGQRLAERYRVIAFDRPGFGYSTRRTENASDPAVQAAILRRATADIGVRQPIVVGHSWGSAVAMAWAVGDGAPPKGVVTVSGVMFPYASPLGKISRAVGLHRLFTAAYQSFLKSSIDAAEIDAYVARIFHPQPVPPGYIGYVGAPLSLRDATLAANAADLSGLVAALERLSPSYRAMAMPVEALLGTADDTISSRQSRALAETVQNGRATILDGIGHMAHHARPDDLVAAIDRIASA
jgi:pimeloyl-ACP methyl ester carboxylesterase